MADTWKVTYAQQPKNPDTGTAFVERLDGELNLLFKFSYRMTKFVSKVELQREAQKHLDKYESEQTENDDMSLKLTGFLNG